MGCLELLNGLDVSCRAVRGRFYQSLVLINRGDVDQVRIRSTANEHNISFNLKEGKSGVLFRGNGNSDIFRGEFNKTSENSVPFYEHNLQLPIIGAGEYEKSLIIRLDAADFFAAIQLVSGEVEIYGFDNGLTTGNYSYRPQSGTGGAVVPLVSRSPEYRPPYVYRAAGRESAHFQDLFRNVGAVLAGDFNDDFNNDFDNAEI